MRVNIRQSKGDNKYQFNRVEIKYSENIFHLSNSLITEEGLSH